MRSKTPINILVSTRNPHKLDEIHAITTELPVNLVSLAAFPDAPEVEEDADTLDGNATKKSQVLFLHSGLPTMADDTGLEVEALGGAPGVHSARYAGEDCDDAANRLRLLNELDGVDARRAQFRTVISFTTTGGTFLFEGICPGHIGTVEKGDGGFGYDSLFIPEGSTTTFAEMDPAEKNKISHRARALKRFASYLSGIVEDNP